MDKKLVLSKVWDKFRNLELKKKAFANPVENTSLKVCKEY